MYGIDTCNDIFIMCQWLQYDLARVHDVVDLSLEDVRIDPPQRNEAQIGETEGGVYPKVDSPSRVFSTIVREVPVARVLWIRY